MTTVVTAPAVGTGERRWLPRVGLVVAGLLALQIALRNVGGFPARWDIGIGRPFDDLYDWIRNNQRTSPIFTRFFTPISHAIRWMLESLTDQLIALPWFGVAALAFVIVARTGKWRMAAAAAGAALFPGFVGLWEPTMETLSLMLVSVLIVVVVGVPMGVAAAADRRVERVLRPVLDAMQTVPTPAYLVPAFIVFATGDVPAAVATVIYALPPVVRLTILGIGSVPPATVEASNVFGATRRQTLFKVQLPHAVPAIATGVNQTINMALGIVVIASFVGAGGLGQAAIETMRQRRTGRGLVVGLAIVAVAIVLDRVSRSFIERRERGSVSAADRRRLLVGAAAVVVAVVVGRVAHWTVFPHDFGVRWSDPFDDGVTWVRDTFRAQASWINDTFVRDVYVRSTKWVSGSIAWPVWVAGAALIGRAAKGWGLAAFAGGAVVVMGLTGWWLPTSETFVQVMISVVLATAIAVPVGIWAGRRSRVEPVLSPILDAFQTVPSVVYIIPFVVIFGVSVVPGIIASVMYAIAPGIRVTALGIGEVPAATIEAATTFGATPRQLLWGVRVPLALSAIMVAVNQVILMVVAMVIIVGFNGGGALGYRLVESFQRQLIGQGIEVSLCLTLMAMVLDRITQALALRAQPPAATH
ncbi:ABC transporter permease subunit [soil metagenome]